MGLVMAEMKAGYKQTEIGVIPEDWDIKSYGEVFDFLSTISNSRADLCFKGDFGYIHYGDIHTRWENTLDLSKSELPELRRDKIKKLPASLRDGDLVMADASEDYEGIAKTVEVKNIGEKKVFSGLHTFLMRDRNSVFSDGIRGYIHEMPIVRQQIQKVATGLNVFGVSKNTLKNVQIPVPKPEEQKQIAAALSDVDGLIESLEKLIAKKRDMKTAAMQQLLTGKKRLLGFDGEWDIRILSDIGKTFGGLTGKTKLDFGHGHAQFITFTNVMNNPIIDLSDLGQVNIKPYESQNIVKKGDLIFNGSSETPNELGLCSILSENLDSLYLNSFCFGFRLTSDMNAHGLWLCYLFRSQIGRDILSPLAQGATRYNLSKTNFLKLEIPYPSYKEQEEIAQILFDMDTEVDTLEQRLAKARSLKTGMMQELLTGKTRLING